MKKTCFMLQIVLGLLLLPALSVLEINHARPNAASNEVPTVDENVRLQPAVRNAQPLPA